MFGSEFKDVSAVLTTDEAEQFRQSKAITLVRKNGRNLEGIIPISITNHPLCGQNFLCLELVEPKGQKTVININSLTALKTAEGMGEYQDQQLVEFTYFTPKTNSLEVKPRQIYISSIAYGAHANHQGEIPDFYLVGEDTQYTDQPREKRLRCFPFWRINQLYGLSEELATQFIAQQAINQEISR
jgi:hypothetical protein